MSDSLSDGASALVRVEGVNFEHFIYDTEDLNTVRGAGLLLLKISEFIEPALNKVEILADGASVVLLKVPKGEAPNLVSEIKKALQQNQSLKEATFAVECVDADSFPDALAESVGKVRFSQMQAPSLVYPSDPPEGFKRQVCEVDHVRPAAQLGKAVAGKRVQSNATFHRRKFGQEEKTKFYTTELERSKKDSPECWHGEYSLELGELAGNSAEWDNLEDKMAVIHLDANDLGKFLRALKSSGEFQEYSRKLRNDYQAGFLAALLKAVQCDSDWRNPRPDKKNPDRENVARLETLLWGGDELTFVVPAWKGLAFLDLFYECSKGWLLGDRQIAHAGGLVFCHHNAPIHPLVCLAKELAEFTKNNSSKKENRFAYLVLESFDNLRGKFTAHYAKEEFPFAADHLGALTISATQLSGLLKDMPCLRDGIPRKKLIEITRLLRKNQRDGASRVIREIKRENEGEEAISCLSKLAFEADAEWFHLTELWDYAAPQKGS